MTDDEIHYAATLIPGVYSAVREFFDRTGCWPRVDEPGLWPAEIVSMLEGDPGEDQDPQLLPHDRGDWAQRVAVANFAGMLAQDTDNESVTKTWVLFLRHYLSRLAIWDVLRSTAAYRWELQASTVAHDLERILALARFWDDADPERTHYALIPRALFLTISTPLGSLGSLAVDPTTASMHEDQFAGMWNAVVTACAVPVWVSHRRESFNAKVDYARGIDPFTQVPIGEAKRLRHDGLLACRAALERLSSRRVEADPVLLAIRAWAHAASEDADTNDLSQAARDFERLARVLPSTDALVPMAHRAAAYCWQKLGKFGDAESSVRAWIAAKPEDAAAHRALVEVRYRDGRIPDALAAFEGYLRLTDGEAEDNWLNPLVVSLGLEFRHHRSLTASIEAAALTSEVRPQGEALVMWFAPWFPRLSKQARERFWTGLYTLSSPALRRDLSEPSIWEQSTDAIGEAVALELKNKVLWPFVTQRRQALKIDDMPKHWAAVAQDRATLGNVLRCLLDSAKPKLPIDREFVEWLRVNRPQLLDYVRGPRSLTLMRLAHIRGAAQHDTVSEEEARRLFEQASDIFEVLSCKS